MVRKTFHDEWSFAAERRVSEAKVDAEVEGLKFAFRSVSETVKESNETISSINDALLLANSNAKNAKKKRD